MSSQSKSQSAQYYVSSRLCWQLPSCWWCVLLVTWLTAVTHSWRKAGTRITISIHGSTSIQCWWPEFLVNPKSGVVSKTVWFPSEAPRLGHHFCFLNSWKILSRGWDMTWWRCLQKKTFPTRTNFVKCGCKGLRCYVHLIMQTVYWLLFKDFCKFFANQFLFGSYIFSIFFYN